MLLCKQPVIDGRMTGTFHVLVSAAHTWFISVCAVGPDVAVKILS